MGKTVRNAFTLVELLVVISLMALVSTFTLVNYGSFGKDQSLKNASLEVQNLLRQAQASATANAKCDLSRTGNWPSASWQVIFTQNADSVEMKCQELSSVSPTPTPIARKTISLPVNITIQKLVGQGRNCPLTSPVIISYLPVSGQMDWGPVSCTGLRVNLMKGTTDIKSVIIEKGGRIYEPSPTPTS